MKFVTTPMFSFKKDSSIFLATSSTEDGLTAPPSASLPTTKSRVPRAKRTRARRERIHPRSPMQKCLRTLIQRVDLRGRKTKTSSMKSQTTSRVHIISDLRSREYSPSFCQPICLIYDISFLGARTRLRGTLVTSIHLRVGKTVLGRRREKGEKRGKRRSCLRRRKR